MSPAAVSKLLALPAEERVALAIALWESLTDRQREAEFELDANQCAELDRRWAEHISHSTSAVSWDELRRKLHRLA